MKLTNIRTYLIQTKRSYLFKDTEKFTASDNYAPVMSLIQNTKFRSDFRNLLPWDVVSVGSGADKITHSANVMLTWGDSNETCYISFHSDRVVSFDISGKTEFVVYHPTKRKTLNELAVFIKENGVLQE